MPTMTKRVNVRATVAVRNTNPPIYGTYKNIIMTTGDILKCLTKRATVDEILPDGSTIRLNYKNYYIDNGAGLDAKGEINIIKPKQPPVKKKVVPVQPIVEDNKVTFNETSISSVDETVKSTIVTTEDTIDNIVDSITDDMQIGTGKIDTDTTTDDEDIIEPVTTESITTDTDESTTVENTEIVDSSITTDVENATDMVVESKNDKKSEDVADSDEATADTSIEDSATPEKKPTANTKKKTTSKKKK